MTIVIHTHGLDPVVIDNCDQHIVQPANMQRYESLAKILSQGYTYYLADSELYSAAGMQDWCYQFLHVPCEDSQVTDVIAILRLMDENGVITQPQWRVFQFRNGCPIEELIEQMENIFGLGRDQYAYITHRSTILHSSEFVLPGDTLVLHVRSTSRAARSRSRSIRRMIPQDDDREADDDISLLQFMDQRLTSFLWIRTDDCHPSKSSPRETSRQKKLISLEEAIPVTDVRTPLNLCDALWPSVDGDDQAKVQHQYDPEDPEEVISLRQAICKVQKKGWEGLHTQFNKIPNLHPSAQLAVSLAGIDDASSELHIFTDGSAKNGQASWAFVVLSKIGNNFSCVGFAGDLVDDSIGEVDQDCADAEATALIGMAEYVLSLGSSIREVHCFFDALAVGFGANGQQAIVTKTSQPARRQEGARILLSLGQSKVKLITHHVHAHECAESLASAIRNGWRCPIAAVLRCGPLLQHPLRRGAWIEIAPTDALPSITDMLYNVSNSREATVPDPVPALKQ